MLAEEKFNLIFNDNFKRIIFYCYNLCGDYQESYDIAQEVFIRASRESRLSEEGFAVRGWLYKVARNVTFDYFRRLKSRFQFLNLYQASSFYEIDFETSETYEEMHKALQKIPLIYREILYLRVMEDVPYDELSKLFELPVGTVMSRLSRGKELLKEVIENERR